MKKRIISVALALCLCISSQSVAYAYQDASFLQNDILTEETTDGSNTGGDEITASQEDPSQQENVLTEEATDGSDTSDSEITAPQEDPLQQEDTLTEETTDGSDTSDGEITAPQEDPSQQEDTLTEETTDGSDVSDDEITALQEEPLLNEDALAEETTDEVTAHDNSDVIPTPTEVYEAMIAFKDKEGYTEGTTWTDDEPYSDTLGYYRWSGGTIGGVNIVATGCVAFAFTLSDAAFGSLTNRTYAAGAFSYEDIKVGDILRVNNDTHTVIVLEVSDVGVVIAEGNNGGKVHWGRTISKEDVMNSTSHYITRYPEGYVSPDDPTANDVIESGTFDGGFTWELTKAGTLTISGSGAMPDFSGPSEQPWYSYSSQIRKVIIENGVTSIGSSAFYNCGVLSVEIPTSVTAIGNNAFYGSSLISVAIPASVKTIGESVFRTCQNLSSVTFSEGLETIGQNTFRSCESLTSIELPASIGEVGDGTFFQCTALLSATFASGSKQVKLGDNLFTGCYYLMSVTLPQSIDKIGDGMFQNCRMLPGVIIPQGAESIGGSAFASSGVSVVLIPDSVTTIGIAAFSSCPLTDIYYTGTQSQWNSVSKIGDTASTLSNVNIHYEWDPNYNPNPNPDDDDDDGSGSGDNSNDNKQPTEYVVTFVVGSDEYREKYEVGSLISEIPDAVYEFVGDAPIEGLYTDNLFTAKSKWNQSTSVVLADTILYVRYAAQIKDEKGDTVDSNVLVQIIPDQVYTGADIKPDVVVYSVDGTLLKKGKDYTITYTKGATTNANIDEDGEPISGVAQPYLTINGKGNYNTKSVKVYFNIKPASIGSGDTFATGFTAKINESIIIGSKPTAVVTSLKYKKAMTIGIDYTVEIAKIIKDAENDGDTSKEAITTKDAKNLPAVSEVGSYEVTITGKGNYCGTVTKIIGASDKDHLLSNATVKLGSSIKKLQFESIGTSNSQIDMNNLASGETNPDAAKFSVIAKTKDTLTTDDYTYKVVYANGTTTPSVGKAQLIITAKPGSSYYGSKSVAFTVVGTAAKKGVTVDTSNIKSVPYTGTAHTEYNTVAVKTSDGTSLKFNKDYTITYKNNVNKGTATMTFTMLPESGYTGSIKATFKITAAEIKADLIDNKSDFTISGTDVKLKAAVSYSKAGVKPSDQISMVLSNGYELKEGTDYTVAYKNNTAVSSSSSNVPTMTIKGKGNFTGAYAVKFDIKAASLKDLYDAGDLVVTVTSQAYKPTQTKNYAVKIKVTESGKALSVKKDYKLSAATCDAGAVKDYIENNGECPTVTISGGTNGCYEEDISVPVPLSFYEASNKMTAKNVKIAFKEDGKADGEEIKAKYQNGVQVTMDDTLVVYFTAADGTEVLLDSDSYVAAWGKNNTAGSKKGTVTITGQGKYGGSATIKFDIEKLDLTISGN